jgi:hypothetical protein
LTEGVSTVDTGGVSPDGYRTKSNSLTKSTELNISKPKELVLVKKDKKEVSVLESLLLDFKQSRAKLRKPMTDKAMELLLRKLSDYSEAEQIAMLEEAIEKGWQTIYPPKQKTATQSQERKQFIANYNFT